MKATKNNLSKASRRQGAALVIVLAFVVLLTGLIVAYFSRSIAERQMSDSSYNQTKADNLAQSASDIVISDLKQEISDSNSNNVYTVGSAPGGSTLYFPKSALNMLPSRSGNPTPSGSPPVDPIPNLIRISSAADAPGGGSPIPSPGVSSRASAVNSTSTYSSNGRNVSLARWNKHYLIPRSTALIGSTKVDSTPTNTFNAPDWVFVTKDKGAQVLTSPSSNVIGRYAYAVYDEGGLLDVNAAGFPSPSSSPSGTPFPVFKASVTYADLSSLPNPGAVAAGVPPAALQNSLVGWRNYATTQPSGSFPNTTFDDPGVTAVFNKLLYTNTSGYRKASLNLSKAGDRTDQMFLSRQQLIGLRNAIGDAGGFGQDVLQYLGTFSRDLVQPSFSLYPDPSVQHPQIQGDDGGNDAYLMDRNTDDSKNINPPLLKVTVTNTFTRNDGVTKAIVGEPLMKSRFDLNRLAWLTYKGPSVNRALADPDMVVLLSNGITPDFLAQGTPTNIQAYFGLTWDSTNNLWTYRDKGKPIPTLSQLAQLATPREPNFFEILKATVNAGAIAKGATAHTASKVQNGTLSGSGAPVSWEDAQYQRDISTDIAIVQLGANIMDQFDADGFPTRIIFDPGSSISYSQNPLLSKNTEIEITGVENLPYFYRTRSGVAVLEQPVPGIYGSDLSGDDKDNGSAPSPAPNNDKNAKLTDPGAAMSFLEPEVWNPHDANYPVPNATLRPTNFRLVLDSALLNSDRLHSPANSNVTYVGEGATSGSPLGDPYPKTGSKNNLFSSNAIQPDGKNQVPPFYDKYKPVATTFTQDSAGLYFTDASGSLFREPTMLIHPHVPNGSNLSVYDADHPYTQNVLYNAFRDPDLQKYLKTSKDGAPDCIQMLNIDTNKRVGEATPYVFGLFLGVSPYRWVDKGPDGNLWVISAHQVDTPYYSSSRTGSLVYQRFGGDYPVTYRMQYKDPAKLNTWITYDQKTTDVMAGGQRTNWSYGSGGVNALSIIGQDDTATSVDPRTSRFGFGGGHNPNNDFPGGTIFDFKGTDMGRIDPANAVVATNRVDYHAGSGTSVVGAYIDNAAHNVVKGLPFAAGWYPGGWNTTGNGTFFLTGLLSQNDMNLTNDLTSWNGSPSDNNSPSGSSNNPQFYTDPDGVARRAMGAYAVPPSGAVSYGYALARPQSISENTAQAQSRPIVLNRPFRSVAELGYVFSGTPWKNLDFFTPESGYAGLLDVFCTNGSSAPNNLAAGKISLNTRQLPVLKAILMGSYLDEEKYQPTPPGYAVPEMTSDLAGQIATALLSRTSDSSATGLAKGRGPLANPSELVGRWIGSSTTPPVDGSKTYTGFTSDLNTVLSSDKTTPDIERIREATVRALANAGQTRVWNLMIDVIAQTGRYPNQATFQTGDLQNKFYVDGEQRYWVHVAIDRFTGRVLDKQIEVVKE